MIISHLLFSESDELIGLVYTTCVDTIYARISPNCEPTVQLAFVINTLITSVGAGSWDDVFKVAVALYIIGTLVWNIFSTGEKVLD